MPKTIHVNRKTAKIASSTQGSYSKSLKKYMESLKRVYRLEPVLKRHLWNASIYASTHEPVNTQMPLFAHLYTKQ